MTNTHALHSFKVTRKLQLVAVVAAASLVFSQCSADGKTQPSASPSPNPGDLSETQLRGEGSQLRTLDQASQSSNTKIAQQNGVVMKQLSDFPQIAAKEATIETSKGDITFTLYQKEAPITVANFLSLAKDHYYDGIKFHRIIADFMAQVGDPLTKDDSKQAMWGSGGPGYVIPDEFSPELKHDQEGTVSMANAGPNTGGSQIFITYGPTPWLDGKHAIFGRVTKGMDVLRKLEIGDTIKTVTYR